jgi:hypothetical protein
VEARRLRFRGGGGCSRLTLHELEAHLLDLCFAYLRGFLQLLVLESAMVA